MQDSDHKLGYYKESINTLEGLKDDLEFIGASEPVMALLQELIDACRWDLKELAGDD